jgi:hypothetical protein
MMKAICYMVSPALMNMTGLKIHSFLCGKILANGSTKPAKLKEHLTSVHPETHLTMRIFSCEESSIQKAGTLPKTGFAISQKNFS